MIGKALSKFLVLMWEFARLRGPNFEPSSKV
ncbi:hypothetical protein LINPERPRIM_LOCUS40593 [Linum perenne]